MSSPELLPRSSPTSSSGNLGGSGSGGLGASPSAGPTRPSPSSHRNPFRDDASSSTKNPFLASFRRALRTNCAFVMFAAAFCACAASTVLLVHDFLVLDATETASRSSSSAVVASDAGGPVVAAVDGSRVLDVPSIVVESKHEKVVEDKLEELSNKLDGLRGTVDDLATKERRAEEREVDALNLMIDAVNQLSLDIEGLQDKVEGVGGGGGGGEEGDGPRPPPPVDGEGPDGAGQRGVRNEAPEEKPEEPPPPPPPQTRHPPGWIADDQFCAERKKIEAKAMSRSVRDGVSSRRWTKIDLGPLPAVPHDSASKREAKSSIVPFDLAVNDLRLIEYAPGAAEDALGESAPSVEEDYLPIVVSSNIKFRFRTKFRPGTSPPDAQDGSAYRIECRRAHSDDGDDENGKLWDSGKIDVKTLPDYVPWDGEYPETGDVVKWRVHVWDKVHSKPSTSEWTKFAVGPDQNDVAAKWIAHPDDVKELEANSGRNFWIPTNRVSCDHWKARRPLPLARAKFEPTEGKVVSSALLIVAGLGSFRASFDGKPLSSSSPLDPPLTDFTQRVSYRGFDVTPFFRDSKKRKDGSHVIGVTLGTGWWDSRPLDGSFIKPRLLPRGALTTIVELYLTYDDGTGESHLSTGVKDGWWQMAKGHVLDSDLYTGDTIDLGVASALKGWDTPEKWDDDPPDGVNWVEPVVYRSETTTEKWREVLSSRGISRVEPNRMTQFGMAPIGKLVPMEIPPVLPTERIEPESVVNLNDGRWLYDFGKAMSGVVRFDDGLPQPIVRGTYPRGHGYANGNDGTKFVTVVYGESIELTTGDINRVLVAGMGLHDGGPRNNYGDTSKRGGPCYPEDHGTCLTQRDVFVLSKQGSKRGGKFDDARQSMFTTHGFRFAEVCCFDEPPQNVVAVAYRTAVPRWGTFSSSNKVLNGAYEMALNAFASNMLGTQSDCPHREKMQYGGDILANSEAAMHLYDLSAFYRKIVRDWTDVQWANGAYTETSPYMDLNDERGIGKGAGETVWASLPAVLSARHFRQYGDYDMLEETFPHNVKWCQFLDQNWSDGMKAKYPANFDVEYDGKPDLGLGDWLSLDATDTYLTHASFFLATARSVAYAAAKLVGNAAKGGGKKVDGAPDSLRAAVVLADKMRATIAEVYGHSETKGDGAFSVRDQDWLTPNADLGLFARVVPGTKRCEVLREWIRRYFRPASDGCCFWNADDERFFLQKLNGKDREALVDAGLAQKTDAKDEEGRDQYGMSWKKRSGMTEGIFAIKYVLTTLSDMGHHNLALSKASSLGFPGFEYMLSHNATTLWESWFRSEDVYSRNHPMFGAIAGWLPSAVAGVGLSPAATGGRTVLFWPRIPSDAAVVEHAGAVQGTKRGDAAIGWEFRGLPSDGTRDAGTASVVLRLLVPPGSDAVLRLPQESHFRAQTKGGGGSTTGPPPTIKFASRLPDLDKARSAANEECLRRRKQGKGFDYNWEYDRSKDEWSKVPRKKAIGTACRSFLFHSLVDDAEWNDPAEVQSSERTDRNGGTEVLLKSGLYEVEYEKWRLTKDVVEEEGFANDEALGSHCHDTDAFDWRLDDAAHLI